MEQNRKYKQFGVGIRIIETGEIFETRTQCANHLGVTVGMVSMCLSGKVKNCKGYHLETVEYYFDHDLTDEILDELYSQTGIHCEWRKHPTRPNIYVSDTGMIAKYVHGQVILKKQHEINSGYLVVGIGDLGTIKTKNPNVTVHRLVAETFVPNPYNKPHINHIDGDKFNNAAYNLEWCTRSENMRHAYEHGLWPTERVRVVETGKIYNSHAECARDIGGTSCGICDCKTGRQKRHRGYHFEFLEVDE